MGHLLWWPINGLTIELDAIQITLTFSPVQHSVKLLWRIGIVNTEIHMLLLKDHKSKVAEAGGIG
jgi:hypothetical protein